MSEERITPLHGANRVIFWILNFIKADLLPCVLQRPVTLSTKRCFDTRILRVQYRASSGVWGGVQNSKTPRTREHNTTSARVVGPVRSRRIYTLNARLKTFRFKEKWENDETITFPRTANDRWKTCFRLRRRDRIKYATFVKRFWTRKPVLVEIDFAFGRGSGTSTHVSYCNCCPLWAAERKTCRVKTAGKHARLFDQNTIVRCCHRGRSIWPPPPKKGFSF